MPHNEDVYQAVEDGSHSQRFSPVRIFKGAVIGGVIGGVIAGACLVVLSMVGLQSTNATESTDLIGMPTGLRSSSMNRVPPALASIGGPSPWKDLGLASLELMNRCDRPNRDVSANALGKINSIIGNMDKKDQRIVAAMAKKVVDRSAELAEAPYGLTAGMVSPVKGLWDPFKFSVDTPEGELLFFREAELKHGRVCMLATLGFYVQEKFHPLFGGDIDVPAIKSVGVGELALFWPIFLVGCALPEILTLGRIDYSTPSLGFTPSLAEGEVPGDLGFDPLGLKPDDPDEFLELQNKEILNGRLAMISAAGMIAQEVLTGAKLDQGGIYGDEVLGGR